MSKTVQGIESILPSSLNYKQMKKSLLKGDRKTVKLFPATNTNQFSYNGNRVIQFNLPSGNFLDLKNTRLCFEAYGVGNTNLAFNNHIESIFNKVEIFTGDSQSSVELLQDYNVNAISNYMYDTTLNYGNTIANTQEGWSFDLNLRNQWCQQSTPNAHGYAVRLMGSGVFNCTLQYLPLKALANNGGFDRSLVIQLTLEAPQNCMIDVTNTYPAIFDYVVQNLFLQMELIDCPSYEMELTKKIQDGMVLGIPYCSHDHWVNTLQAGQQGDLTFQMNSYYQMTTGFKTLFKNSNAPTTTNVDYTNTYYRPLGLSYYQVQVGNKVFPTQRADIFGVNSNAIQYNELLKYFNKGKDVMNGVLVSEQTSDVVSSSLLSVIQPTTNIFSVGYPATLPINAAITFPAPNSSIGWKATAGTFTPFTSGYYQLNLVVQVIESTVGANSTGVQFTTSILNNGVIIPNLTYTSNIGTIVVGVSFETDFLLNNIVYLNAGDVLTFRANLIGYTGLTGSTYTLTFRSTDFSANLVSTNTSPWASNTYLIGTTFKTWYDCESYMRDQLEYFLDGMDMSATNQIVFKFGKNQADSGALNLFHWVDYIGALVIDKNGVSIVK